MKIRQFKPQPDITAYELAKIVVAIQIDRAHGNYEEALTEECYRHFIEPPPEPPKKPLFERIFG